MTGRRKSQEQVKYASLSEGGLRSIHAQLGLTGQVVFKETTVSTNDDAKALAEAGAPEGTLVVAEHQTGGKGRLGRRWEDCSGEDILFSLVLRPRSARRLLPALTAPASVAVVEALQKLYRRRARIKWPNDIMYRGKKLGGVLVEGGTDCRGERFFVVGVGINAGKHSAFDGAMTLETIVGFIVDRERFLAETLARLIWDYGSMVERDLGSLEKRWKRASATMGKTITIQSGREILTGFVIDLSLAGGLVLELDDGTTRVFRGEHATIIEHPWTARRSTGEKR